MTVPLGLARIERETVQERVYATLRDKLMRGGFEPGQKLKIADLAGALGTSAMPVRDALNRLAAERAVESLPNRGMRVPALSKASLQDLMEARFAVEGLAVERASLNMRAATISTLRGFVDTQSKTDDAHISEESAEQNRAFHFTIYRSAESSVLLPIIESLWLQCGPYLRIASERFDGRHGPRHRFSHRDRRCARARRRRRRAPGAAIGHRPRVRAGHARSEAAAASRRHGVTQPPDEAGFELYDLRVEVVGPVGRPIYCGARLGDYFELHGEMMKLPPGQGFSIYSLAAVLPLLAAKQRITDENDWMTSDAEVACPDPNCPTRFKITRTGRRYFRRSDVTATEPNPSTE